MRDYAAENRTALLQARPAIIHTEGELRRILFQVWAFDEDLYDLSLYIIEDHPGRDPVVKVRRNRYYAVTTDTLTDLMREAGFQSVERLDEAFYQPVLVGQHPRD